MPSMFISSLQWGGSEIVGKLFLKSGDFVYARVSEELSIPVIFSKQFINFYIWRNNSDEDGLAMKSVYDRLTKPDLLVKEKIPSIPTSKYQKLVIFSPQCFIGWYQWRLQPKTTLDTIYH